MDLKAQVLIYCKIFTDTYPTLEGTVSGQEIYSHLMADAGHAFDETHNIIPGDKNIWYLCSNEKHGFVFFQNHIRVYKVEWGMGESDPSLIKNFIEILMKDGFLTGEQYSNLLNEVHIAKRLGDMYQIPKYLQTTQAGKKWIPMITPTRNTMKKMKNEVEKGFTKNEYSIPIDQYKRILSEGTDENKS